MGRKTSIRDKSGRSGRSSQTHGKQGHLVPKPTEATPGKCISIRAKKAAPKWFPFLVMATCACAGGVILLFTTTWGIGVSTDSITYIDVARNFLKGYGLSHPPGSPMTHYPPLYPIVLSISGLFASDPLDGARWLQTLFFCATIAISGLIIYRETGGSAISYIIGLLLLLTSNTLISVYSFAWSEGLFILLSLAGFLLLGEYLQNSKTVFLLTSSIITGLALLTRYVGISLVLTGCLCILALARSSISKRLIITAIFGIVGLCPVSLWVLRNRMLSSTLTNRSLVSHPITLDQVNTGILTISSWLCIPQDWSLSVRIGLLVIFAAVILTGFVIFLKHYKHVKDYENRWILFVPSLFIIFTFSYFLVLGISISFVDAHTPLSIRILSPLYVIGVIGIVCLSYNLWVQCEKRQMVAISLLVISSLFLLNQSFHAVSLVNSLHHDGSSSSFLNKYWKQSTIIERIKSLPDNITIYTNAPDPIDILAGKSSIMLPAKVDAATRINNEKFPSQFADMAKEIQSGKSILVYFSGITWRWYLPTKNEIAKNTHLRVLYQGWDGMIYGAE
jgi:hypothetical protein